MSSSYSLGFISLKKSWQRWKNIDELGNRGLSYWNQLVKAQPAEALITLEQLWENTFEERFVLANESDHSKEIKCLEYGNMEQ